MSSKFELMLSQYTPLIVQQKDRLLKQRKKILISVSISALIVLAFVISASVIAMQDQEQRKKIKDIQEDIGQAISKLNQSMHYPKISLNDSGVIFLKLSCSSNPSKKFLYINLSGNPLQGVSDMSLPDLSTLDLGANTEPSRNFFIFRNQFPQLKTFHLPQKIMLTNNTLGLQTLPQTFFYSSDISFNTFLNVKTISSQNCPIVLFMLNKFPVLESMYLKNTSTVQLSLNYAPKLKSIEVIDISNVLSGVSLHNLYSLEQLKLSSNNFFVLTLQNIPIWKESSLNTPRIKMMRVDNIPIKQFANNYDSLKGLIINSCNQFQQLDLSTFPNLTNLHINQSSLEKIYKKQNSSENISLIEIYNTSIKQFSNFRLSVGNLVLSDNHFLTQFSNNFLNSSYSLSLPGNLVKIQNNVFRNVMKFQRQGMLPSFPQLESFHNNSIFSIRQFSFCNTKMKQITGNRFGQVLKINLSNNKFDDAAVLSFLKNNKWSYPLALTSIDLSNNQIINKTQIQEAISAIFSNNTSIIL